VAENDGKVKDGIFHYETCPSIFRHKVFIHMTSLDIKTVVFMKLEKASTMLKISIKVDKKVFVDLTFFWVEICFKGSNGYL
jgi:hypothetical protein